MQFGPKTQKFVLEVELVPELPHFLGLLRLFLVVPQNILYALHYDRELLVLLPRFGLLIAQQEK